MSGACLESSGASRVALLAEASGLTPRCSVSGKRLTTFCIGGELALLVEPSDPGELRSVLSACFSCGFPVRILGGGSNLLIPDEGISDVVIRMGKGFRYVKPLEGNRFEVGAAMPLMTLSKELSLEGRSGLEFAGGIPASFGGAVRMNAGAHGGEMSEILREVRCVLPNGESVVLSGSSLEFSYRRAHLPEDAIVVSAVIELIASSKDTVMEERSKCLAYRKATQPLHLPSAGSVFKNPSPECSAGSLIEKAGLKGRGAGGAKVSALHANWIVNEDRTASAGDVSALIELCQSEVKASTGISLEPELVKW